MEPAADNSASKLKAFQQRIWLSAKNALLHSAHPTEKYKMPKMKTSFFPFFLRPITYYLGMADKSIGLCKIISYNNIPIWCSSLPKTLAVVRNTFNY